MGFAALYPSYARWLPDWRINRGGAYLYAIMPA